MLGSIACLRPGILAAVGLKRAVLLCPFDLPVRCQTVICSVRVWQPLPRPRQRLRRQQLCWRATSSRRASFEGPATARSHWQPTVPKHPKQRVVSVSRIAPPEQQSLPSLSTSEQPDQRSRDDSLLLPSSLGPFGTQEGARPLMALCPHDPPKSSILRFPRLLVPFAHPSRRHLPHQVSSISPACMPAPGFVDPFLLLLICPLPQQPENLHRTAPTPSMLSTFPLSTLPWMPTPIPLRIATLTRWTPLNFNVRAVLHFPAPWSHACSCNRLCVARAHQRTGHKISKEVG